MRFILWLALAGAVLFGGYWAGAAYLAGQQAQALIDRNVAISGQPGAGRGFPRQFQTIISAPAWQDPAAGRGWRAEAITLQAESLRPMRLAAQLSPVQALTLDEAEHALDTHEMVVTGRIAPDLTLAETTLEMQAATLTPPLGLAATGPVAARLTQTDGATYALRVDGAALTLGPGLRALLDPGAVRAGSLDALEIRADLTFEAPLDPRRTAPRLTDIALDAAQADWDGLEVALSGEVTRDDQGLLDGRLRLELSDWQALPRALVDAGMLEGDTATMAAMLLASQAAPDSQAVALDLRLTGSAVALGPFTLARLPPF